MPFLLILLLLLVSLGLEPLRRSLEGSGEARALAYRPRSSSSKKLSFSPDGNLHPHALCQAIILAMNDNSQLADVYASLPVGSLDGISQDEFRRFVQAVRPVSGESIRSFTPISDVARTAYLQELVSLRPELQQLAEASTFYQLNYGDPKQRSANGEPMLLLAIQTREDGTPYIAYAWSQAIIRLHDYVRLYFSAIETAANDASEGAALRFLLKQERVPFRGDGQLTYLQEKTDQLLRYYAETVSTIPSSSRCQYLLPGLASYLQNYRYGSGLSGIREVQFKDYGDAIAVREPLPETLDSESSRLLLYGRPLFAATVSGHPSSYRDSDLSQAAGKILSIQILDPAATTVSETGDSNTSSASPASADQPNEQRYQIRYADLTLEVLGQADLRQPSWEGRILRITSDSTCLSLGKNLRVGLAKADFYLAHPFYNSNEHSFRTPAGIFSVTRVDFQDDGEKLTSLSISPGI